MFQRSTRLRDSGHHARFFTSCSFRVAAAAQDLVLTRLGCASRTPSALSTARPRSRRHSPGPALSFFHQARLRMIDSLLLAPPAASPSPGPPAPHLSSAGHDLVVAGPTRTAVHQRGCARGPPSIRKTFRIPTDGCHQARLRTTNLPSRLDGAAPRRHHGSPNAVAPRWPAGFRPPRHDRPLLAIVTLRSQ